MSNSILILKISNRIHYPVIISSINYMRLLSQWHMKMIDHHKIKWTFYIIIVIIVLVTLQFEMKLFSSLTCVFKSDMQQPYHKNVIIIDGGSTGTRMHIYRFYFDSRGLLSVQSEVKKQSKQGLSKLANKPYEAAKVISNLLKKAEGYIPYGEWKETPVAFKATASFRKLPKEDTNSVLREVLKVIEKSPFLHNNESASILSGEQEALYAWYALSFLLDRQNGANQISVLIDVGGQSVQIAFAEDSKNTEETTKYKFKTNLQQKPQTLYTRSYLGIGLVNAGMSLGYIVPRPRKIALVENDGIVSFLSPCIHPNETFFLEERFEGILAKNQTKKEYCFDNCYDSAVEYLGDLIHRPLDFGKQEIYALSALVRRASALALIDNRRNNNCTVGKFVDACTLYCENSRPVQPFLCLECVYISALWKHGLGLKEEKDIKFIRKIRGIETKWTLGAALNMLV